MRVSWHGRRLSDAVADVVDVGAYIPVGNINAEVVSSELVRRWSLGGYSAERVDALVENDCLWV